MTARRRGDTGPPDEDRHEDAASGQNPDTGSGPKNAAGGAGDRARPNNKYRYARGAAGSGDGGPEVDDACDDHERHANGCHHSGRPLGPGPVCTAATHPCAPAHKAPPPPTPPLLQPPLAAPTRPAPPPPVRVYRRRPRRFGQPQPNPRTGRYPMLVRGLDPAPRTPSVADSLDACRSYSGVPVTTFARA